MTDVSKMALKILYTLDNGSSGTYLARSKRPQAVTVITIPNPTSPGEGDQANFRIGAVELSPVLQEIYMNSPELLSHNGSKSGHDYNLYYKDICELDEPLVSLGLLSQIRHKLRKENGEDIVQVDEHDDDETFIVTGRICSNFAALLKRSYSNSCSIDAEERTSSETLEVKLRFIRVVTEKTSRRPSNTVSRMPRTPLAVQTQQQHVMSKPTARPQKLIRPVKGTVVKRQMNQTPAPKAERTQSLPIWNPKQQMSNNTAFPANSIAHKIYLADRKTDNVQPATQQPLAYQINALQQDNTIQKYKVDDSVSKRFDFMLNKKKDPQQDQQQGKAQTVVKKTTAAKARRFNTMAAIPVPPAESKPKIISKKSQRSESICEENLAPITEENFVLQDLLEGMSNKRQSQGYTEDNKENQPQMNDEFDLDLLSFPEINAKSDLEWFGDFSPFHSPSLIQNLLAEHAKKPSTTTPKDANTCNTISIDNAEEEDQQMQEEQGKSTSDIDRTSPIDTLSMPLMELNDRSNTRMVSCQEQLRRLPILGKGETTGKGSPEKDVVDNAQPEDEVTSIVMQLSSSCQDLRVPEKDTVSKVSNSSQASTPALTRCYEYQDGEEDELSEGTKRQRTMPSSPTHMFNYEDDLSSAGETNDLFSSFIQTRTAANNNADSTPATQYGNQSSDHSK